MLESGSIVRQTARSHRIRNMLGAAASNSVWLAKTLPREQLAMRDPFCRTPLMLAAWFKSHEMLEWLSAQLQGDSWQLDVVFVREVCGPQTAHLKTVRKDHAILFCILVPDRITIRWREVSSYRSVGHANVLALASHCFGLRYQVRY